MNENVYTYDQYEKKSKYAKYFDKQPRKRLLGQAAERGRTREA